MATTLNGHREKVRPLVAHLGEVSRIPARSRRGVCQFSSQAQTEADIAFVNFTQFTTPELAQAWYQGLIKTISSLQEMPRRCSIARENAFFSQEIRQLLYGSGKSTYRILFAVLDDQPTPTVRILHIRNALQRTIGEPQD